jgi:hypothetical protein
VADSPIKTEFVQHEMYYKLLHIAIKLPCPIINFNDNELFLPVYNILCLKEMALSENSPYESGGVQRTPL